MANDPSSAKPQPAGDGCVPINNTAGALAKKLGGSLWKNDKGTFVLKGVGADETAFPDQASALHELKKRLRASAINAESANKIKEIVAKKGDFHVTDWEGIYRTQIGMAKAADTVGGGERPPYLSRDHGPVPQVFRGGTISNLLTRGHANLMQLGAQYSANAIKRFDTGAEQLELAGENHLMPALDTIDKWTNMQDIHEGVIPPEAQQLHDKVVAPLIKAMQGAHDMLGTGHDVAEANGFPKWHGVVADDIDPNTLIEAQKNGFIDANASKSDFARLLNTHDGGGRRRGESQSAFKARMQWLQTTADGLSRDSNHARAGMGGFNPSYKATMLAWNRSESRRIMRAAVFGSNDERIKQMSDRLTEGKAFGETLDKAALHDKVMKSLLGDNYTPRSAFERSLTDIARFPLGASGSRHIAQTRIALIQVGFRGAAAAIGKELFNIRNWKGTMEEWHDLGITAHQASHFMDQHPSDAFLERSADEVAGISKWSVSRGVTKALGIGAKASTMGLHVILNLDRRFAHILARNSFDKYWEKALKGDRDTLGHFADTFGFGEPLTPAGIEAHVNELRKMNQEQMKRYYVKRRADIVGTTFHPSDVPGMTRIAAGETGYPIGKWLTMFKTFKWNVSHNVWNQMTSDNYSLEHRMHVFGRFIATSPLSAIDPIIRHAKVAGAVGAVAGMVGVGGKNMNSELAYKSFKKSLDNHEFASAAYALTMLYVNDAVLGPVGDLLQAVNVNDYHLWDSAFTSEGTAPWNLVGNAAMGAVNAASAAQSGDDDEKMRAERDFLAAVPFTQGISRMLDLKKPPKLPKKPMLGRLVGADTDYSDQED